MNRTHALVRMMPVLVPPVTLVAFTGAIRCGNALAARLARAAVTFNATESTFAAYAKAGAAADAGNDAAALALLRALEKEPIRVDASAFRDQTLSGRSAMVLLSAVGGRIVRRARAHAESGDDLTARRYVAALYALGDRLAASDTPTLDSLRLAHRFHCVALCVEGEIYSGARHTDFASTVRTLRIGDERQAAGGYWRAHIAPKLLTTGGARDVAAGASLAARLGSLYRAEWARVHAPAP